MDALTPGAVHCDDLTVSEHAVLKVGHIEGGAIHLHVKPHGRDLDEGPQIDW